MTQESETPRDPESRVGREPGQEEGAEREGPTIRDRRRIDPTTYEVREPQQSAAAPGPGASADGASTDSQEESVSDQQPDVEAAPDADPMQQQVDDLTRQVAERTDDLQRLQAEYVNYKRRVDRDREAARTVTIGTVMSELLPILDNIQAAREHDELTGGFKAVGESIEKLAARHAVAAFGEVGDEFDPHLHDALMQVSDPGDAHPVCAQVFQVGYRMGERVLRPARVATGAPTDESSAAAGDGSAEGHTETSESGVTAPVEAEAAESAESPDSPESADSPGSPTSPDSPA